MCNILPYNMMCRLLFVLAICQIVAAAKPEMYRDRADPALQSFNDDFAINTTAKDCATEAITKGDTFQDKSPDYRAAVSILNIYTQYDCMTNDGKEFYRHLNNKISVESPPYKQFADLLNEAIDILSEESGVTGVTVYRGQRDFFPAKGPYQPLRFTSTSTNFFVALDWATSGCFVKLDNVTGVLTSNFSSFPDQNEVLLKSSAKYMVNLKYVCQRGIYTMLKTINPSLNVTYNTSYVTSIVEMTHKPDSFNMTSLPVENDPVGCPNATDTASFVHGHAYETTAFVALASIIWNFLC